MSAASKNPLVIIVDDDKEDIYLAKRAFKAYRKDLDLIGVGDGSKLLDYLAGEGDYKGSEVRLPSIILLDINMPKLNGFEILTQLRANENYAHIPIIMLTTSDSDEDVKKAYALGANSYVCKSVNAEEMKKITVRICEFWLEFVKLPNAA